MINIKVIHGPHLNRLGQREHGHYGYLTLNQLNQRIQKHADLLNITADCFQSDNESEIIAEIHRASSNSNGLILNPAGLGYTSLMLRDAVIMCRAPVIEVHLSNIHARESFRSKTIIADVCRGQICGLNWAGYCSALNALKMIIENDNQPEK